MYNDLNNQHENYINLSLVLSPSGKLYLNFSSIAEERLLRTSAEVLQTNFAISYAHGLLYLGVANFVSLSPSFAFWQKFSRLFLARVCHFSGVDNPSLDIPVPNLEEFQDIIQSAPLMIGVEYLNVEVLDSLWQELIVVLKGELQHYGGRLQSYFSAHNSTWNLVGRVCFHLAENKSDTHLPFAFLATYTDKLSSTSGVRHLPLGNALQEYAGEKNKTSLLGLLLPVQKAAAQSAFINNLVEKSEIFHPLAWSSKEAYQFLQDIPLIEAAGVIVRVPNWWNSNKPPRPKIEISIGQNQTSCVGMDALLDFDMHIALSNGEKLTETELEQLLNSVDNLIKVKGQWIEIDRQKLIEVLEHWKRVQSRIKRNGLTFSEGLRLLAGVPSSNSSDDEFAFTTTEWSFITAGDYLLNTLKKLRNPDSIIEQQLDNILNEHLNASLRTYQIAGREVVVVFV